MTIRQLDISQTARQTVRQSVRQTHSQSYRLLDRPSQTDSETVS